MGKYRVVGVMSGSSMDGVDLAYCELEENNGTWAYTIGPAETVPYEMKWRNRLSQLYKQTAMIYAKTDAFYGRFLGHEVKAFVERHNLQVDFIASHGHTVFHAPAEGYTSQIGDGAQLYAATGLPVVCDFRTVDVALGGQGAPLVPAGEKYLFPSYGFCLNLGGFANLTANSNGDMFAFDICPCNIILNRAARLLDQLYDEGGRLAAEGQVNDAMLEELNGAEFYQQPYPKSLNREWINKALWPINKNYRITPQDKLATFCAHIGIQVANSIEMVREQISVPNNRMLVTGGGAFNHTLLERIRSYAEVELVVPDEKTVNFKEALIFAFLGVLRVQNKTNCLQSVTGAQRDNTGGAMYGNFSKLST